MGASMTNGTNGMNVTYKCGRTVYPCYLDDPIDPDIAGLGVLASFVASAVFVVIGILVGYFTDSLPDVGYNQLDYHVINGVKWFFRRKPLEDPSSFSAKVATRRRKKQDALEKFILALSDQQLITGFAILVAAYTRCELSVYSFKLVFTMSWFSMIVHVATLAVIARYLRRYPPVRMIRLVGMIAVAIMIIPSTVINTFYPDRGTQPLYCMLNNREKPSNNNFRDIVGNVIRIYLTLAWLIRAYDSGITEIMGKPGQKRRAESTLYLLAQHYLKNLEPIDHVGEATAKLFAATNEHRSSIHSEIIFILGDLASAEHRCSFYSNVLFMVRGMAYGATWIIVTWVKKPRSESRDGKSVFEMGFGQIVPLFLLVIPIVAVLEVFYEVQALSKDDTVASPAGSECEVNSPSTELEFAATSIIEHDVMQDTIPISGDSQSFTQSSLSVQLGSFTSNVIELETMQATLPISGDMPSLAHSSTFELREAEEGVQRVQHQRHRVDQTTASTTLRSDKSGSEMLRDELVSHEGDFYAVRRYRHVLTFQCWQAVILNIIVGVFLGGGSQLAVATGSSLGAGGGSSVAVLGLIGHIAQVVWFRWDELKRIFKAWQQR